MNILQDYEAPDNVLHQQLFEELKYSVPLLCDYIDVFFRLNVEPTSTLESCLMDEMEDLRDFHGKNQTLAFKHRDTVIGLLRHCVLFDLTAKKFIKQNMISMRS